MSSGPTIEFVPPSGPTQAELRISAMKDALEQLPQTEREEIQYVNDRIFFLRQKYGSSAEFAIVFQGLLIAKEKGQ